LNPSFLEASKIGQDAEDYIHFFCLEKAAYTGYCIRYSCLVKGLQIGLSIVLYGTEKMAMSE